MRLFYRMNFFTEWIFFLRELNFLKRDTNIYFKQITFFEKKKILWKSYIFFLRKFFFQISFATFEQTYRRCSKKKGVLKILAKFTGKHLC